MQTFFTEKDLVSFGNHLLSLERTQSIVEANDNDDIIQEKLNRVNQSDIDNWKAKQPQED